MTFPAHRFSLSVSYSQIYVFDASLLRPFNDWTTAHVVQGFSWRPGSAAFATEEDGQHTVVVASTNELPEDSGEATRIIEVPFEVVREGRIEIGSIADSIPLQLPPGLYCLRYEYFESSSASLPRVQFGFALTNKQSFRLVRPTLDVIGIRDIERMASPA